MLFIELRWLLFFLLLAIVVAILLAAWLGQKHTGASLRPPARALASRADWAMLDHAPLGLLVLEDTDDCRYANAQARHMLGLPAPTGPLPQADWVPLLREDRETARQDPTTTGQYSNVPLASGQVVRWWITPWRDLDVVFVLDVTALRQAEQASGRLLSDLSHELRTPLATILTHLEVLLLDDISPEIERRSLGLLKTEARRMARLVNDMLELGRLETIAEIAQRPVDLLALAERAIAQVAPQAEEREIASSLRADSPLPLVSGDADRLLQVLLNLLDNAIKYSKPGDRVEVTLRRESGTLTCSISDTGPGIPAEHLPHITRRFYRAAPAEVEGSGLGLALVKEILRRHSSQLEIQSYAEGEATGTRVSFSLPILPEEAQEG